MGFGSILSTLKAYAKSRLNENKKGLKDFTTKEAGRGFDNIFDKVAGDKKPASKPKPVSKPVSKPTAKKPVLNKKQNKKPASNRKPSGIPRFVRK